MAETGNTSQMVFRVRARSGNVNITDPYIQIEQTDEGAVVTVTDVRGSTEATIYNGVSITGVEKTGTEGLVDTYTIYFSDGSTTTYTVTNGKSYTVDDEMSPTSENPVQNRVVYSAIPWNIRDGADGAIVLIDETELSVAELKELIELHDTLTNGQSGQFLMSDGNGGFTWATLSDVKVYPGGIKL